MELPPPDGRGVEGFPAKQRVPLLATRRRLDFRDDGLVLGDLSHLEPVGGGEGGPSLKGTHVPIEPQHVADIEPRLSGYTMQSVCADGGVKGNV